MESFYGGRQGASFVIKRAFKYLDLEDPAFLCDNKLKYENGEYYSLDKGDKLNKSYVEALGKFSVMSEYVKHPDNKELWYNEYCIIDTENKNNPNNGKIYRRTINETGSELDYPYAEYQGQIVGPSSGAAFLRPQSGLLKFSEIREQLPEGNWDGLGIAGKTEETEETEKVLIYDPSFSDGKFSQWPDNVELQKESIKIEEGLVEGASEFDSTYDSTVGAIIHSPKKIVDDIVYNWFNVRKNTENNEGVVESWCYIGFEVPYSVFSVSSKYKTPGTRPLAYETENSKTHPFWWDWRFEIPGGLRGVSIERIFINDSDVANDNNNDLYEVPAYLFDNLEYDIDLDKYTLNGTPVSYTDRGWFCEARIINPSSTSDEPDLITQGDKETVTFFLGEITEIDNVTLNTKTGHLEFVYHNQETDPYDLRYPIDVRMEEETGHVEVEYSYASLDNTEEQKVHEWNFRYPIEIDFTEATDDDYQGLAEEAETPVTYNTGEYFITYSYADETKGEKKVESDQLGFVRKVIMSEGENNTKGAITFVNTKTEQNQSYPFSYPQDMNLNSDTGEWKIDYFGAESKSGQIDFIDKAFIDSDVGKITFHHTKVTEGVTDTNGNFTQDFIYPKLFDLNPDTGEYTIYYSNSNNNTSNQLVFPKSVQMDTMGNVSYINSANKEIDMGQLAFVDDVIVDGTHQLLIAYTDNTQLESKPKGTVTIDGKEYINYGQTIGKLGVTFGPMPSEEDNADTTTIKGILAWYETKCPNGIPYGETEVSGQLHVVTTEPTDDTDPISYFIMWDPDAQKWYQVSEIAGAPVGIPAQIGGLVDENGNEVWTYATNTVLADGVIRLVQLEENEEPLVLNFPWM